ncbi:hypothetical protein ACHAXS_006423 [Conticribra weissflogii]
MRMNLMSVQGVVSAIIRRRWHMRMVIRRVVWMSTCNMIPAT